MKSKVFEETQNLMKKYGINANKKLGQNFLVDDCVIEKIIETANLTKEDLVIEIGPGLGTLTKELLEKAGKVICIELDNRMIKILQDRFLEYDNFEIINEDVLKVDLQKIIKENKIKNNIKEVKVVANLPYYITTPIIMKLLEDKLDISQIVVMIQKEVAERLASLPGDKKCGAITYTVYYYAQVQEILTVPNTSFIPQPEVESEVISLNLRKEVAVKVEDEQKLFKLIKVAFMMRRKTLVNAIVNSNLGIQKEKIENVLEELKIDKKVRGENLSIEDFAKIAKKIK